jgi:coenzyme F420-reducing hydrogenase delta subunit
MMNDSDNRMIHLFYCANSMTEDELQDLQARLGGNGLQTLGAGPQSQCIVIGVPLPCSGKMTVPYLLKAFEKGADGVVVCSCPPTQCKQLEGNLRAPKRAQAVDELIEEIGLGKGRVRMVAKEQGQIEKVIDVIQRLEREVSSWKLEVSSGDRALQTSHFALPTSQETPYGVTTSELGRAAAAGTRSGDRLENAA